MNSAPQTAWALGPATGPIDADVSKRIDVLRFVLIALIVFAHTKRVMVALTPDLDAGFMFVVSLIDDNITQSAVPLFFMISGYLFLRKFDLSMDAYLGMCRKKLLSILVPYILFNLIWVLWIYFVGSIEMFGSKTFLLQEGIIAKTLGIGTIPINYPLWFLRDLLIVFIVSPILLVYFKEAPLVGALTFLGLWIYLGSGTVYSLFGNMFAFYLGGFISRRDMNIRDSAKLDKYIFPGFLAAAFALMYHEQLGMESDVYMALMKCKIMVGVVFFWCLSRYGFVKNSRLLHLGGKYSFFIYLTHEPTLGWLQSMTLAVYKPVGSLAQILYDFGSAITIMVLLGCLGALLSRLVPGVYAVATGARRRR